LWTRLRRPGRFGFGLLLVLLVVVIWVSSSALIQFVFKDTNFNRPFFLTYFSTSLFTVYLLGFVCLPWRWNGTHRGPLLDGKAPVRLDAAARTRADADDATQTELVSTCGPDDSEAVRTMAVVPENLPLLSMRESASGDDVKARSADRDGDDDDDDDGSGSGGQPAPEPSSDPLTTKQVVRFAFFFAPLWFVANLTFNWSLSLTSVSSTAIISSSSCLFTLVLGIVLRQNVFRWVKVFGILLTVGGVVCVALYDTSGSDQTETVEGDIVCLLSAIAYAVYVNVLQRGIGDESRVSMAMFFGFVGLWNMLLMWPFFLIFHWTALELYVWPDWTVLGFLLLNGSIGTVLSDWVWLQSMLLTTPLVSTLGLSLTIPLALVFDLVMTHKTFRFPYIAGALMTLAGFVTTTLSENKTKAEVDALRAERAAAARQVAAAAAAAQQDVRH
jgi:solute carrier family 35 protein F5